jgi:hypothetical protein
LDIPDGATSQLNYGYLGGVLQVESQKKKKKKTKHCIHGYTTRKSNLIYIRFYVLQLYKFYLQQKENNLPKEVRTHVVSSASGPKT